MRDLVIMAVSFALATAGLAYEIANPGSVSAMSGSTFAWLLQRGDVETTAKPRAVAKVAGRTSEPESTSARIGEPIRKRIGSVEIPIGAGGHYATVAYLNGRSVDVLVDTGASMVAISAEDAERAGIYVRNSDFTGRVSTANGIARVAPITLDSVAIGDIVVRNVKAIVGEPGAMRTTLLGMTFLNRLSKVEFGGGVLALSE